MANEVTNTQLRVIAIVTAEVNLINLICSTKPDPGSNVKHEDRRRESVKATHAVPKANKLLMAP